MIETWKQPPPIEDSVDIVSTALKLQSAQFRVAELPETATILDQNALKQRILYLKGSIARLAINQEIIATKIQDQVRYEADMIWDTISTATEANQQNVLGYIPGRYYWNQADDGRFIRSRNRYRPGFFTPQSPDQASGRCVGIDFENSAIVIKPDKLKTRLWGSRQWIHLINPDGEPLVELNFPDLR